MIGDWQASLWKLFKSKDTTSNSEPSNSESSHVASSSDNHVGNSGKFGEYPGGVTSSSLPSKTSGAIAGGTVGVANTVKNFDSIQNSSKGATTSAVNGLSSLLGSGADKGVEKYSPSDTYLKALQYTQAQLDKFNEGRTSYTDKINSLIDEINGREPFSYDFNNDAMFQSYLQSMQASGQNAMADTMGQAAALTGGYGSSYATSAGSQAYNNYIQNAYNNLPDYAGYALDVYNAEGNALKDRLSMYKDADDTEYNRLYDAYKVNADYANSLYDKFTGSSSASGLKTPTSTQYSKALALYQSGDMEGLSAYVDAQTDMDVDAMAEYLQSHEPLETSKRTWSYKNGSFTDQYNNKVSDKELFALLQEEGLSFGEAYDYIITQMKKK